MSLLGGKSGGIGATLGTLAGTGLGSILGPAGAAIGAGLGKAGGSLIESALSGGAVAKKKPPTKKRLSKYEERILAEGAEKTRKTGNPAYAEEASTTDQKFVVVHSRGMSIQRKASRIRSRSGSELDSV